MTESASTVIVLRFRDLPPSEPGGTIAEHRKIVRHRGYVWWGWWCRETELIPKAILRELFPQDKSEKVPIILFKSDSKTNELYRTRAGHVLVAPTKVGIHSPEVEATPNYYAQGRCPIWFQFVDDIVPMTASSIKVTGRPTTDPACDKLPEESNAGDDVTLVALRADPATLWLSRVD